MIIGAGQQFPPNNSHCKALLRLDADITDYSADALTVTNNGSFGFGNPGSVPFGADAAYLENATGNEGDNIQITYASKLAIGTKPYTISMWIYPKALKGFRTLLSNDATPGTRQTSIYLEGVAFRYYTKGAYRLLLADTGMTINNWYHLVVARESTASNKLKLFINGALKSTYYDNSDNDYTSDWYVGLSKDTTNLDVINGFYGYVKGVQIHIGQCLYNRAFTPPNRAS